MWMIMNYNPHNLNSTQLKHGAVMIQNRKKFTDKCQIFISEMKQQI